MMKTLQKLSNRIHQWYSRDKGAGALKSSQAQVQPTITILKSLICFGSCLGFFPYKWDRKTQRVRQRSGRWKWVYALWTTAMAAYFGFLVYGCYGTMHDPQSSAFAKTRALYMTVMNGGLLIGFFFNSDGNQLVINQVFYYALNFKDEFGMDLNPTKLNVIAHVVLFTYCFGCSNSLAVLMTPESRRLLTSLLEDPKGAPPHLMALMLVVHFLLYACQFFYIGFNLLVLFCYVCLVTPVIERLRWTNHQWTANRTIKCRSKMTPELLNQHSLALLVLQSAFTGAYGPWVLMITVWGIVMVLLNAFQTIVFWHVRSLVAGTVLALLLCDITKSSARVYETAVEVRNTWRDLQSPLWFAKHVRAWKPASVPLGSFFYFDRGVWPTFMNIILTSAANLIVSYNEGV